MYSLLKRFKKKKMEAMRTELAHAHLIIALLSIALIALLALGSTQPVSFDATMSAICVALLSIVTIVSLCISITLYRNK
jgi:Flp pilus assembly pilin Flp